MSFNALVTEFCIAKGKVLFLGASVSFVVDCFAEVFVVQFIIPIFSQTALSNDPGLFVFAFFYCFLLLLAQLQNNIICFKGIWVFLVNTVSKVSDDLMWTQMISAWHQF